MSQRVNPACRPQAKVDRHCPKGQLSADGANVTIARAAATVGQDRSFDSAVRLLGNTENGMARCLVTVANFK